MKKFLISLVFLFVPALALCAQVQLGWDANSEPDLAGYRVYQGVVSGSYGDAVAEIPAGTESALLTIEDGTYFWVVTAYDNDGNESGYSNEVTLRVDTTAPAPPTGLWGLILKLISWLFNSLQARVV